MRLEIKKNNNYKWFGEISDKYSFLKDFLQKDIKKLNQLKIIKKDIKNEVGILENEKILVKKFKYKNILHKLKHKLLKSRANHLFHISTLLENKRMNVPEPIFYLDGFDHN
ncbi:hypothetical protein BVX93_01715, partial [bacterium B13(2017)]